MATVAIKLLSIGDALIAENLPDDTAIHVGQPMIPTSVAKCELFVVESQLVQDGGMDVVNRNRVRRHCIAEFVCLTVSDSSLKPAAGKAG